MCFPLVYKTFIFCNKIIILQMLKQNLNQGVLKQKLKSRDFMWGNL